MDNNSQQPVKPATPVEQPIQQPQLPTTPPVQPSADIPAQPAVPQPATLQVKKSSNSLLIILIVIVISLLLIGVIFYKAMGKTSPLSSTGNNTTNQSMNISPSPTLSQASTSDTQLNKDSQSIDNSMNSLNTDVQNANQSVTDQPADLSQ